MAVEAPHELRRHPDAARITWLAAFVYLRARSLTDDLVDLLIETIHRIGARAERKVERELLNDIKRVGGKQNLLFELADATLAQPDGVVREVVFPGVGEETLRDFGQGVESHWADLPHDVAHRDPQFIGSSAPIMRPASSALFSRAFSSAAVCRDTRAVFQKAPSSCSKEIQPSI